MTTSLRRSAAVLGIGISDWSADYRASREGKRSDDSYGYAAIAYRRALADSGLDRSLVDGLIVGPTTSYERVGEILGIDPRWGGQADAGLAVIQACMALQCGLAKVVALVYGNDQRSASVQYGGPQAMGGQNYLSYVYHAPWGLTSQGALYALMFQRYCAIYGVATDALGPIAVAQRANAAANPDAIMRKPVSLEDYARAAFVCEPLRLLDYCLVNDGGVCLLLTADPTLIKRSAKPPVHIEGVGRADLNHGATSLEPRLLDFYLPAQQLAASQLYDMSGVGPQDVDALQIYDSFSCHILFALEGFGYCAPGEGAKTIARRSLRFDGDLPVNTGGGHLSESYMQGWNHQVESIRQLRGEGGSRQVKNCRRVQYISDVAGKVVSIMYGN